MNDFTPKQQKVFDTVKAKLEKEVWYRWVCCYNFPTDQEIDKDFDCAVARLISETKWWDGWLPSFLR